MLTKYSTKSICPEPLLFGRGISPALPLNDPHHACLPRTLLVRGEFPEPRRASKVEKRIREISLEMA